MKGGGFRVGVGEEEGSRWVYAWLEGGKEGRRDLLSKESIFSFIFSCFTAI